jgi:hypothetical protein
MLHQSGKMRSVHWVVIIKLGDAQPIVGLIPKLNSEATMYGDVVNRLHALLA